jgi:hypothetical protein
LGKTEGIITLLNSENLNPIVVKEKNNGGELISKNNSIILDDVSFLIFTRNVKYLSGISLWTGSEVLSVLDRTRCCSGSIKVLDKKVIIPENGFRVVITNDFIITLLSELECYPDALARRIKLVTLKESLIKLKKKQSRIKSNNF